MKPRFAWTFAVGWLVGVPMVGLAQLPDDFRTELCRSAFQDLRNAPEGRGRWRYLESLWHCGSEGGVALADELRGMNGMTDLDEMQRRFVRIVRIRDASLLDAALELAEDKTASVEVRAVAFRVLLAYENPGRMTSFASVGIPWETVGSNGRRALDGFVDHAIQKDGRPVPEGWEATVQDVLTNIVDDRSDTEAARFGARRTLAVFAR